METKSASRSLKKNANTGPGTAGDRKKAKQKKKKEKRKQSLKGTESTDIPSPELDSEVPFDGDATLTDQGEGERSSAGQVTKLPHLTHSAVSLTTQVLPTDTASTTTSTTNNNTAPTSTSLRKLQLGQASSAPTLRTSEPIATKNAANSSTTTAPTTTTVASSTAGPGEDGVVARVASLTIKQRSSKPRSKTQSKASSKASRTRNNASGKHNSNASNSAAGSSSSNANGGGLSTSTTAKTVCSVINESLRWEYVLEDVEKERERIALYKLNRRKRYLAAAQAKGLRWAMNYNTHIAVSPLSEDSGVDTTYGSSSAAATAYLDFAPMTSLRPMPAHRGLQEAFVEC